jgi:hypothetical protein
MGVERREHHMTKKCRDCFNRVGADGWRCDACAARWKKYTDDYIAARDASGGKGWEHAYCDHAYGYCAATPSNTYEGITK